LVYIHYGCFLFGLQIDEADILEHGLQNTPADSVVLLHLHKGVNLNMERDEDEEEDEMGVEEETLEMRRHADWLHQVATRYSSGLYCMCRSC
jgi:hypothetical protein